MCSTTYDISEFSGLVTSEEICSASNNTKAALLDGVMYKMLKEAYQITNTNCDNTKSNVYCLYLYLYALESWNPDGDNFFNENQLQAILTQVEQISKLVCNG